MQKLERIQSLKKRTNPLFRSFNAAISYARFVIGANRLSSTTYDRCCTLKMYEKEKFCLLE